MASIRIRVGASLDANALKAFEPIEKAAAKARRNIEKDMNATGVSGAKAAKQTEAAWKRTEVDLERQANKILKDHERGERQKARTSETAAKQAARAYEQAERERTRALEQEERKRQRIEQQASREREREERRARGSARGGGAIGIGRRAAISVSKGAAIAYGAAGSGIHAGLGLAESLAEGMGVNLDFASHLERANEARVISQKISNAGYVPGAAGAQGILQDPNAILGEARKVGNATGTGTNEILEGLQGFVGLTGDLETGRASLMSMARLAKATGSDFVEMAHASAEVANHLGDVPDKAAATEQVMRVIAGQGKLGALEIRDFAEQMAKIAANAPKFEGSVVKNIGELGLLAQEAKLRGGAASASQAATSVLALATAMSKGTTIKHWGEAGLNPYTDAKHTQIRSPEELILEALRSTKGDQSKLTTLFGSVQAGRAVTGFANIYNETKGNEDAKIRAVVEEFDRLRSAQLNAAEVSRAFGVSMSNAQSKAQIANNRLDEMAGKIADAVLPALAGLAPALESLTPLVVGFIEKAASFLGIDTKADDRARADARLADQNSAFGLELDAAEKDKSKSVDRAHVEALKKNAQEIRDQIAADKSEAAGAQQDVDKADPMWEAEQHLFGVTTSVDEQKTVVNRDKAHIQMLEEQGRKTNELLERLAKAQENGLKITSMPTPPPDTGKTGHGASPAESESPDHSE